MTMTRSILEPQEEDGKTPETEVRPPVAEKVSTETNAHGVCLRDDYGWLREREDSRVRIYLEGENAYTAQVMKPTEALQETLYQEMVGRIEEDDETVPAPFGPFEYYSRTREGKQYPIFLRRRKGLPETEQVLLDINTLAVGKSFLKLGALKVSPDHRFLAYSLDEDGSERFSLRILDLESGALHPEVITNTARSLEWRDNSRSFYYVTRDAARRPYKVFHHVLGSPPAEDPQVYYEEDERFFLSLSKTRSQRYLCLKASSHSTTEIRYLAADGEASEFRLLSPRCAGIELSFDHHGGSFYILSNEDAPNFRLMKVSVKTPQREHWQELIPHRSDEKLEAIDLFREHLVVYLRSEGLMNIRVLHLETEEWHQIEFEEPTYTIFGQENHEFETSRFRFGFMSLVTPRSVFEYDLERRERCLLKRYEVLGGYCADDFCSERLFAPSADGTAVPISLVYRRGTVLDGSNPLLLYGYGAYGHSMDGSFSTPRLSLLERGFVYAIAHVRGGGELGRHWYDGGKLANKQNTFSDFIAAAEHLIDQGYTSPDHLVIRGGSAGGLLIGAVLNQRPELFSVALAEVPFVDVINTMLDPSIPLTVIEYEEWGDPRQSESFRQILAYSPYDNVCVQDYPSILVVAGLHDPRVQYWEPAKWTAKLRALKTDQQRLLLKMDMDSGHGGPSGRYDALRQEAFKQAFILDTLLSSER